MEASKTLRLVLFLLQLITHAVISSAASATVNSIEPRYGSANGATKITVKGSGFESDLFTSTNNVTLQANTRTYVCQIHEEGVTEEQIECYTPAMPYGTYFVKVMVNGVDIPDAAHCRSNSNNCKYTVSASHTPLISTIEPSSTPPAALLTVTGRLFTDRYGSNMDKSSNGKLEKVLRVWCANMECSLRNLSTVDENYGFYLFENGTSDNGEFKCKMGGSFVGHQNCSMIIEAPYGRTMMDRNVLRISTVTNKIYMVQTYAEVESVSPTSGSTKGGTILTIAGKNFDNTTAPLDIRVGDAKCVQVGDFTQTEIKCRVEEMATPLPSDFPGGRGVSAEVFPNTDSTDFKTKTLDTSQAGYNSYKIEHFKYTSLSTISVGTIVRIRGFISPPRNATYSFTPVTSSQHVMYLSTDSSESSKAEYTSNTRTELIGGRNYYMEARIFADSGTISFSVKTYIANTTFVEEQSVNALADIQKIRITSTQQDEIQTVDLGALSNSYDGRSTVQRVTVSSPDATKKYRLLVHGVSTDELDGSATADGLKTALNALIVLKDNAVTVTKNGQIYTVTFAKKLGSVPVMTVKRSNTEDDGFTVTVAVTTEGASPSNKIRLQMEDVTSAPISKDVSANDLKTAVEDMYSSLCPATLNVKNTEGGINFAQDFETGNNEKMEEPFCGKQSKKNPGNVDLGSKQLVSYYKNLCFAFKGAFHHKLRLYYFLGRNSTQRSTDVKINLLPTQNLTDRWYYTCVDISAPLTGLETPKVKTVRFFRKSSLTDFYIDAITLRATSPIRDHSVVPDIRRRPPFQNDVPLLMNTVSVTKSGTVYTITMNPLNCGHDYNLYSLHGVSRTAGNIGSTSNSASFRDTRWSGTDPIQVQRTQSASQPPKGSFGLTFNGISITGIRPNSTVDELKNMLIPAQTRMGQLLVSRWGSCAGYVWQLKFIRSGGDQPDIVTDGSGLTGTGVAISVVNVKDGGLYYDDIPDELIRGHAIKPQVEVTVNNLVAKNTGTSTFEQLTSQTPTVTAVSPTSGTGTVTVQVTGSRFDTSTASNNEVTIGGAACSVTTVTSSTQLSCTLNDSPAGTNDVVVHVLGKGKADGSVTFTYTGSVSGIQPATGGLGGGINVTITGKGFQPTATVTIGGNACTVVSRSLASIVCEVPPSSGTVDAAAGVTVVQPSGNLNSPTNFQYATSLTATVTSIDVTSASCAGGPNATIAGTGFGSAVPVVYVGSSKAVVYSHDDTSISIRHPPNTPGNHKVVVKVTGKGKAVCTTSISYQLSVTNVYPLRGSQAGGTQVTIDGVGFGTQKSSVSVKFGHSDCDINSITNSQISCTTGSSGITHTVENSGVDVTYGKGFSWNPPTINIEVGDTIVWKWKAYGNPDVIKYKILQVESATSREPVVGGIDSGTASSRGSFKYTFTQPGAYYLDAGEGLADGAIVMRADVRVVNATNKALPLSVKVGPAEAPQTLPGSTPSGTPSCAPFSGLLPGCADTDPTSSVTDRFVFRHRQCLTPILANVSGTQMDGSQFLIIDGSGFGSACQTEVRVGSGRCSITAGSITSSRINCSLSDLRVPIATALNYEVYVNNIGRALTKIRSPLRRLFYLKPHIKSFSPTQGSEEGGTKLTIMGGGFTAPVDVRLDTTPCTVVSVNYTHVECMTGASASTATVAVTSASHAAACRDSNDCQYTYSAASTPGVSGMTPTTVDDAATITLTGSRFGTNAADLQVTLGGHVCAVNSPVTDASLTCNLPNVPAGTLALKVHSLSRGDAKITGTSSLTAEKVVSSISPTQGSTEGGTTITVSGRGFPSNTSFVTATLSGQACTIVSSSLTSLVFITPPLTAGTHSLVVSVSGVPTPTRRRRSASTTFQSSAAHTPTLAGVTPGSGSTGQSITLNGQFLTGTVTVKVGGNPCPVTASSSTSVTCTVPANFAGTAPVKVHVAGKGYASGSHNFVYQLVASSVSPSTGGTVGGQTLTIMSSGFDPSATEVTVCGQKCTDIVTSQSDRVTCKTPSSTITTGTQQCDVVVTVSDQTATISNGFTYDTSLTATINSITPTRGGTAGGTTVTIAGSNFANTGNLVWIGKSSCAVSSQSPTSITCVTGSSTITGKEIVRVYSPGKGDAAGSIEFFYVDAWCSRFTWGGRDPPTDGDLVTIQKNQIVLLDCDTAKLKMLLINGGKLMFDRKNVTLHSESILITDNGTLEVGTEDEPFLEYATIMMHGGLRAPELPIYGAKVLGVRHGTLDLHGKPIEVPWTTLDATANAGDTTIRLKVPVVDWNVNDKIVIASTGERHAQRENEQHEIADISADKRTLTLKQPLEYKHISVKKTLPTGQYTELAAEVGLLSRNVRFVGSNDKQWHDDIKACPDGFDTGEFKTQTCFQGRHGDETGNDQFGAHIMMHAPVKDAHQVIGRIEHVELNYVGQAFRLGRYPIHFHLNGDMEGAYVRGCAIWQTFNRAVNIHGTHNVLIERNVGYNIMGGAFFLEDGIEHGNRFLYNLAVFVRQSTSLLNDDITPAAYWVTNPNNTYQHNHAAGGTHFGFWYRMHQHPDGPSFTPNFCPKVQPMGLWFNNTVHSQGWFGIWVFEEMYPTSDGLCGSTNWAPAVFKRLIAWNNEKGYECVFCGDVQLIDSILVNNEKAGIEGKILKNNNKFGSAYINNTIVSHLPEMDPPVTGCTVLGIVAPFGSGLLVQGTNFVNFNKNKCDGVGLTSVDGNCKFLCGGFQIHFGNTKWFDSPRKGRFRWHSEAVLIDTDTTFTNATAYSKVVPTVGILDPSKCSHITEFSYGDIAASLCVPDLNFTRFAFKGVLPENVNVRDSFMKNGFGILRHQYAFKRLTHKPGYMCLLPTKDTYLFFFDGASHVTNLTYNGLFYDMADEWIIINHNFTQTPDRYSLHSSMPENRIFNTINPASDAGGTMYLNNATNDLFYLVKGAATTDTIPVNPNFYHCYFPKCVAPPTAAELQALDSRPASAKFWSQASTWTGTESGWGGNNNGVFGPPAANSKVKIREGDWIVLDVDPPQLSELIVEGVLEFEPGLVTSSGKRKRRSSSYHNFHIKATTIIVTGRMIVGWPNNPMRGNVKFTFSGNHRTPDYPIVAGPPLGSKGLGVFGRVEMHGVEKSTTWSKLKNSVAAGATSIKIKDRVDWAVNDEIVIVTSDMDPLHSEVRRITVVDVQADGTVLTLNASLQHSHSGESKSFGSYKLDVSAEVGLLSHNIVIEGEDIPQTETDSYGARVLVSKMLYNSEVRQGNLKMANVEFRRAGQLGWDSAIDPRFALSFVSAGDLSNGTRRSYVVNCSFHHIYSHAVGIFDTDGALIEGCVSHRTIGEGLSIEGGKHRIIRNLVATNLHVGTYRQNVKKDTWPGAITINLAKEDIILRDNVMAGAERAGLRTKGESCTDDSTGWSNNVAHSSLIGILMLIDKRFPAPRAESGHSSGCSRIRNVVVYLNYDFGIYSQEMTDLMYENVISSDNRMGILPFVVGASILSHINKNHSVLVKDSLIVGHSGLFACTVRSSLSSSTPNVQQSVNGRGYNSIDGGYIGVVWAIFSSGTSNAPDKKFVNTMAYNTIGGRHDMQGVTFANFKSSCTGGDRAFTTARVNDDAVHPAYFKGTVLMDVDNNMKIYFNRPRVSKINPADCVDMDCDGLKKALIKDLDGQFIGGIGSVIAHSEFEWDSTVSQRRGLGDYRIPKVMLSTPANVRLDANVVYPNKGIIRNSACTMVSAWQAYKCEPNALDYQYLVIENMDSDTEKRRLSPVALATDGAPAGQGYIDLINGPQDHGWCFGYTCQERVSTFSAILASDKNYLLYFTSTSPDKLRLFMINNPDDTKAVRIGIYYAKPNRLDVYANNNYVLPTNGRMQNGQLVTSRPDPNNPTAFMPTLSSPLGTNYMDREWRLLYVVLKGNGVVEIRRQSVVVIGFGVPSMSVDDFFGSNIVQNLATFLGIPANKIRVVDVVAENSVGRRRRRSTGVQVTLEVGDPVSNATLTGLNTTSTSGSLTPEQLANISTTVVNAAQTGTLNTAINAVVTGVTVQTAATSSDAVPDTRAGTTRAITQPVAMRFVSQPSPTMEQAKFNVSVHFVDASGNVVPNLGTDAQPWVAKLTRRPGTGEAGSQLIISNDTMTFVNGYANFTNLYFDYSGSNFIIDVNVTSPDFATNFSLASSAFNVPTRSFEMSVVNQPTSVTVGQTFSINLLLKDKNGTSAAENLDWRSHTAFTVNLHLCSFQTSNILSDPISGTKTATFDMSTATASFTNIQINRKNQYHLCFTMTSHPNGYSATYEITGLTAFPSGYSPPQVTKTQTLRIRFTNAYDMIRGNETQFKTSVYNSLTFQYTSVVFSNIATSEGSIITSLSVGGTEDALTSTLASIHSSITAGTLSITHAGVSYSSDGTMYVDGVAYTTATTTVDPVGLKDTSMPPATIAAIVIVCLLVVGGCCAAGGYYYYKTKRPVNKGKVADNEQMKSIEVQPADPRISSPVLKLGDRSTSSVFLEVGSRPPTGFKSPAPVAEIDQQLDHMSLERETTSFTRPPSGLSPSATRPPSGIQSTKIGDSPSSTPTPAW